MIIGGVGGCVGVPRPVGFSTADNVFYQKYTELWARCIKDSTDFDITHVRDQVANKKMYQRHIELLDPEKWNIHGLIQTIFDHLAASKTREECDQILRELRQDLGDAKIETINIIPNGHPGKERILQASSARSRAMIFDVNPWSSVPRYGAWLPRTSLKHL